MPNSPLAESYTKYGYESLINSTSQDCSTLENLSSCLRISTTSETQRLQHQSQSKLKIYFQPFFKACKTEILRKCESKFRKFGRAGFKEQTSLTYPRLIRLLRRSTKEKNIELERNSKRERKEKEKSIKQRLESNKGKSIKSISHLQ